MAAPRLPFLYPQLFRPVRAYEAGARIVRFQNAGFHASHQLPSLDSKIPAPSQSKKKTIKESSRSSAKRNVTSKAQKESTEQDSAQVQNNKTERAERNNSNTNTADSNSPRGKNEKNDTFAKISKQPNSRAQSSAQNENKSSDNSKNAEAQPTPDVPPPLNPIDSVLQMPPPSDMGLARLPQEGNGMPHLEPAPYIHHFDTYTLVKNLEKGGFSEDQAITVMKAIRGILQEKLNMAEATLTSKSDSENEEYLFKAACSELRSSLQTSRNLEIERQRTSRTHLQHEVDLLTYRINQELAKMNDELKGMWNDHKMTTREQQQGQDTNIQELNYKIAVSLASDGKSETEGLRWVLTRRAALAIAFSAMMAIAFLKVYSNRTHEIERKQAVAKETAKAEPAKDAAIQTGPSLSDTLASESLG